MDLGKVFKLVALAFALIAGMVSVPYAAAIIAILGVIAGATIPEDDAVIFMVSTLALALAHGALAPIPAIGLFITDVLESVSALFNAAACTVIMRLAIVRLNPDAETSDQP